MKATLLSLIASYLLLLSCTTKENTAMDASDSGPELRHVVLFKFKDSTSAEDVDRIVKAFTALPSKIPVIKSIEWGTNNSPEGLNKGLTHCFLLTFNSEEDRDAYLPHPEHKAFGQIAGPHIADVTVVDYWAKE